VGIEDVIADYIKDQRADHGQQIFLNPRTQKKTAHKNLGIIRDQQ
jgi:hypothetical protein